MPGPTCAGESDAAKGHAARISAGAQLKNFWDLSVTLRNLSLTFTKFDAAPSFFQCQIQRAECHIDFVYKKWQNKTERFSVTFTGRRYQIQGGGCHNHTH